MFGWLIRIAVTQYLLSGGGGGVVGHQTRLKETECPL